MRLLTLLVGVLGILVVGQLAVASERAHACSGPRFDPAQASAVVVGRVLQIDRASPTTDNLLESGPVTVTLTVDRYLKGAGPGVIEVTDQNALLSLSDEWGWDVSPACQSAIGPIEGWFLVVAIPSPESAEPFGAFMVYGRGETATAEGITSAITWVQEQVGQGVVEPPAVGQAGIAASSGRNCGITTYVTLALSALTVLAVRALTRPRTGASRRTSRRSG